MRGEGTVISCNFTNNAASEAGGAIYKGSAKNCNFVNNTAMKGSAIYNCDYVNCSFANNFAQFDVKITVSPTKVTYKDESYYKITGYGEDGKLADNTQVVIKINGKPFKTLKTNADGVAKFKVTKTSGTYKLTILALGRNVTKTLTVKHLVTHKSTSVKKSAKKLVLTATLGKINGNCLSKKTVTFKFNGKTYNAKTDKKGIAKVTVKSDAIKKLKVSK